MSDTKDIIIIGGGPSGISAALTAIRRGKSVLIVSSGKESNLLYKAPEIDNYPGLPHITGREILEIFEKQAQDAGAEIINGRALSVGKIGEEFGVAVEADFYMAKSVIIASGINQTNVYEGESEYLGRGVSYCATCDGMLYRGKTVAVIGWGDSSREEAAFLESIGCTVHYFEGRGKRFRITGTDRVEKLIASDGTGYDVQGVFILRSTISLASLMPDLETDGSRIVTDDKMATSVPGVFAAGDCTGTPYQIAKATGEGNIAALSAAEYLDKR